MDNDGDIEMANEMDSDEDEFRGRRNGPNPPANKQKAITDNDNDDVSELEDSSVSSATIYTVLKSDHIPYFIKKKGIRRRKFGREKGKEEISFVW